METMNYGTFKELVLDSAIKDVEVIDDSVMKI